MAKGHIKITKIKKLKLNLELKHKNMKIKIIKANS